MMGKGACGLLAVLSCVALLPRYDMQDAGTPTVLIDGYTHNSTLTSGDSVPLETQFILVCWVVGLPHGTPFSYIWTCPNGPCEVEGYYGEKVYSEYVLAVNVTSTSDGGTYTCQVTATGGQGASGSFTLRVIGGHVVHSYGRLIPHEFPITNLQQISGPDGIGRVTCTVSNGIARFVANGGSLETGGLFLTGNGSTATLVVKPSNVGSFQNRGLYCTNADTNFFYLFTSSANLLSVPSLTIAGATNSAVEYLVQRNDDITNPLITGYEVFRFGVPMIGEYVNAGRGRRITISPAVPGAQYRITAWALLGAGRRSAKAAVEYVTTGEASPSPPRVPSITRDFQAGIELNWLPPTEPNGEVHYVIYYTPECGTEQSIDTGSNLTHYNLTRLERNRVCANISVQAVNSAGRSDRSAVIAQYNHSQPDTPRKTSTTPPGPSPGPSCTTAPTSNPLLPAVISLGVVVLLLITCVALPALALTVTATKLNKSRVEKGHTDPPHYYNQTVGGEGKTTEEIYDEVVEGADPIGVEHYQELKHETTEKRQYATLHGEGRQC